METGKISLTMPKTALLAEILRTWDEFPSMRLGQLIQNAMDCGEGMSDLFNRTDILLLKNMIHYREEYGGKETPYLPTGLLEIHEKRKVPV